MYVYDVSFHLIIVCCCHGYRVQQLFIEHSISVLNVTGNTSRLVVVEEGNNANLRMTYLTGMSVPASTYLLTLTPLFPFPPTLPPSLPSPLVLDEAILYAAIAITVLFFLGFSLSLLYQ